MSESGTAKKKVLLINPSPRELSLGFIPRNVPLALLALSSNLADRYTVIICDRALGKDDSELRRTLADPDLLCVGLSVLTGPCILDALHCTRLIKQLRPSLPVIWGGWHVTKAPESVLAECQIDYAVVGEGEFAFRELLLQIEADVREFTIPGIGYRKNGTIVITPPKLLDLSLLPPAPIDLIRNIEPYIFFNWIPGGGRCIPLETSRGCPYACSFCEVRSYLSYC